MTYRIAQWTAGVVGQAAVRAVLNHPAMELVACYTRPGAKTGKDVGELCGLGAIGLKAVSTIEEILSSQPDLVLYMPLVWDVDAMVQLLEAGVNIISTANFITGRSYGDDAKQRLQQAAEKGGVSLYGSGINPGHANALGLVATAVCREVHHLSVLESVDASGYASPETWTSLGFGGPKDAPGLKDVANQRSLVFVDAVEMMAQALRVQLDGIEFDAEFGVATDDLDLGYMKIAKGMVCGVKMNYVGLYRGKPLIDLGLMWRLGKAMSPDWTPEKGYVIEIKGDPDVSCRFHASGEDTNNSGLLTAMPAVHAIPAVIAAQPGLVTAGDIPLVVAAHCVP